MLSKFKIAKFTQLASNSGLRAIIANAGWLFIDQILRMGITLVIGVWMARYLGADQFGVFNYAIAFVALFNPISKLGLDNVVVRDIVIDSSNKEKILGTTFLLKFLAGIACFVLAIFSIYFVRHDESLAIYLVGVLAVSCIFQAFETIDFWFQSQLQSKYTVLARNVAFLSIATLQVFLLLAKAPLMTFAWTKLMEIGLLAINLVIAYKHKGSSIWLWRWNSSLAKTLLKKSYPLILSGLTIMIYMRIDQIMLGQMIGDRSVGIYSAAIRISEVWYFIPMAISSSVNPSIFAAKETNESLYYDRILKLLRLLVLISIVVAIPMTFLSENIIQVVFGNDYAEAGQVLAIHIWASLFVFMGVATSSWFIAENLTHLSLSRTGIGAIINILLNLMLIPHYGGIGAAIATVISQAFASFFSHVFHPKTRKLFLLQIKSLLLFYS
jgi:polysaccharide transporter, PST family